MFTIEYTVYEDDNTFCPPETYTFEEALGESSRLLADYDGSVFSVKSVTIERVTR